ncbi:MAG: hypothetical protein MJY70_00945 [Bacteroidales bacterium]|nr:hypothetical protein [Bacteroidales bacterium]
MKKILSMIALTVLMVALAGSCTKNLEERLDKTDAEVATLQAAIDQYGKLQSDITTVLQALRAEVGARPASEQQSVWNCINALQNQSNALDVAIRNLQELVGETPVSSRIDEAVETLISEYDLDNLEATLQELKEKVNAKYDVTELEKKVAQLKDKLDKVLPSILKISAIEGMIQSVSIAPAYSDGSVKAYEENILTFKCIVSPAEALALESNIKECFTVFRLEVEPITKTASEKSITVTRVEALDKNQGAYKVTADISEVLPDDGKSLMIALNVKTGLSDYTTDFVKVTLPFRRPDGALPGEFTVNAGGKKVCFSQGNLVATIDATGAPTAWKFATNQYDYIGEGGANKTIGKTAGDIDLFGWSTDATLNNWGIHTKLSYMSGITDYIDGNFKDWGTAIDSKGTWRTLSAEEWKYLFSYDPKSSGNQGQNYDNAIRRGKYKCGVTVCGKTNCVVLLPDNWEWDESTVGTDWQTGGYPETATESNPVTWQTMQAAGAVCLPAAGARQVFSVSDQGSVGNYWSSTADNENYGYAFFVWLSSSLVQHTTYDRGLGNSVRLVTDVEI